MQNSSYFYDSYKKLAGIFLLAVVLCGASLSAAAQDDEIIVEGNPSLRQSDVDKSINVLEKIFDYKFAGDERATMRYYASHDWTNGKQGVIRGIKNIASMDGKIQRANAEQVAEVRELLVADLKNASDSEVYEFLLEIYNRKFGKNTSAPANSETLNSNDRNSTYPTEERKVEVLKNGGTVRDLVGKWERKTGGVSSVNAATGAYLSSSGNYESYEFFADGRVAYTTLIAVQNYGCRLEAFAQSKGRVTTNGIKLNMNLAAGTIRRDDSCSPSKNYTKPTNATNDDYQWRIEKDEYGNIQLALTGADGNTFLYRKAK